VVGAAAAPGRRPGWTPWIRPAFLSKILQAAGGSAGVIRGGSREIRGGGVGVIRGGGGGVGGDPRWRRRGGAAGQRRGGSHSLRLEARLTGLESPDVLRPLLPPLAGSVRSF
jgi:hypothetical protein